MLSFPPRPTYPPDEYDGKYREAGYVPVKQKKAAIRSLWFLWCVAIFSQVIF